MPKTRQVEMEIPRFLGFNSADSFSEIDNLQSPLMLNFIPKKIGSLANRDGTKPLTVTPIGAIKTLCNLRKSGTNSILASSGTTLYKFVTNAWVAQTMTNALASASIDTTQFKSESGDEVLVIADGGSLKYYNGTAVVNITPLADDTVPTGAPKNILGTKINTSSPAVGCIVHNTRVVVWGANSDTIFHSKIGFYDYFRETEFQRFVRENDTIVTCISYGGALLVMMHRRIGVLFGDDYSNPPTSEDWSQDFLDTTDGCINSNTVQTVTYPDGRQEIFYLSDNGVHAVYTIDTLALDSSARYSTRSTTNNKINWNDLGVTNAEWGRAAAHFYRGKYWLIYPKGTEWLGLVFDTDNKEWYPIKNVVSNSFYNDEDYFYYAGDAGHLRIFEETLYSDYADSALTTKIPIEKYWYSKLMTPLKLPTGFDHLWDTLKIEAKQHLQNSTLDVEVNTYRDQFVLTGAIKTSILVIGVTAIGEAQIANINLTDFINNAKRIDTFVKGQYAQIKLSNNRDEPMEIFSLTYEVRAITKF